MEHFFVYGTLMEGLSNYYLVEPYVIQKSLRQTKGSLYHLSYGFPGLILNDQNTVYGEVLEVRHPEKVLEILDRLEDFIAPNHPDNMYERKIITVDGMDCYVYEWARALEGVSEWVPGQNWRKFITQR